MIIEDDMATIGTAEHELEDLLGQLLGAQDEERRRIAGELHDTTAQHLVAVLMTLDRAIARREEAIGSFMEQTRRLVDQSLREIRALCYRLYPPMLEELGLRPALDWLVRGIAAEGELRVTLDLPTDFDRLPRALETCIFRLVQAELANLRDQPGIACVDLVLACWPAEVVLSIEARGPSAYHAFDGGPCNRVETAIGGMRARTHQMGGSLRVDSRFATARMLITLPVQVAEVL